VKGGNERNGKDVDSCAKNCITLISKEAIFASSTNSNQKDRGKLKKLKGIVREK